MECKLELKSESEKRDSRERFKKGHIKQMKRLLITESMSAAKSLKAFGRTMSREKRSRSPLQGHLKMRGILYVQIASQLLRAIL